MIKKNFAFLLICLFFVAVITSACGGGKTTPPDNSAFYYLLAQQNANNNEQEQQNEPTPDPSQTLPTLEVSKSELSLIVGSSEDITVTLEGKTVTEGLKYDVKEPEVAKVENGKVTALAKGSTTVTVSLEGANSAVFTVEVVGKGDYIEFGHYRQTGNAENAEEWKPQSIEWQVLSIDTANNRVLVVSRYGLDAKCFDDDSNGSLTNIWAGSEICSWLNGYFYNTAFNDTEKGFIKPVDIVFNNDGSDDYDFNKATYNVFLLSKAEAEKYFANADARRCEPTAYAVNNGATVYDGYSFWWLRSPCPNLSSYVYCVGNGGRVHDYLVYGTNDLVRPALWINL